MYHAYNLWRHFHPDVQLITGLLPCPFDVHQFRTTVWEGIFSADEAAIPTDRKRDDLLSRVIVVLNLGSSLSFIYLLDLGNLTVSVDDRLFAGMFVASRCIGERGGKKAEGSPSI